MNRILFVEDNPKLVEAIKNLLELNHYAVSHAPDLSSARNYLKEKTANLILLDVNLPDGNGYDFCEELREIYGDLPVVILTANTDESSVVKGLELGANDYVKKPFGNRELLARIQKALSQNVKASKEIRFADLVIQVSGRTAHYQGKEIALTVREFEVLNLLVREGGGTLTREKILSVLDKDCEMNDRTIDSYISHLRTKLDRVTGKKIKVKTVYGLGYRLESL